VSTRLLVVFVLLAIYNIGSGLSNVLSQMQPEIGSAVSIDRIECSEGDTP
jgi:hypothetical protein